MTSATAAVWHGPGAGFELAEVPLPDLAEGEVLVRTTAVTLCGSDLHTIAGDRDTDVPTVLGHEMAGEVVATGSDVLAEDGAPLVPGSRVTWTIGTSCGHCARCRRGFPQKCVAVRKYGHAKMSGEWALNGGLATHCHLLAGTGVVTVPAGLPDALVAPANCATATVVSAVRQVGVAGHDTVLVSGCGMLGLTAISYLRSIGVSEVYACDVDLDRRRLAATLGAHSAGPAAIRTLVLDRTAGEGVAVALDFSGSNAAVHADLGLLAIGGRLGLVGSVFPTPGLDLVPENLVRRLLSITGVHNYAAPDLVEAVRFLDRYADRALFGSFVTGSYGLDRITDAVAHAVDERPPRVMLTPETTRK
ncbi:zinc-binding dehydrogenase [Amycolatopsis sp. NPDC102389]|uniref:zinc-binding dehydrogenase n=1 Tax=Amycolatopsis sp. NPDC102389 TaxID=3363941 RepID=UPI0037FB06EA